MMFVKISFTRISEDIMVNKAQANIWSQLFISYIAMTELF